MTDKEIIKALSTVTYGGHSCTKCKHKISKGEERCGFKGCNIARNALSLINRQKAEIERLKEAYAVYEETTGLKWAKSEAIKEFAERLKEKSKMPLGTLYGKLVYLTDIENLVKEMTEDERE